VSSYLLKIILLGALWLALLFPLNQLRDVVQERTGLAESVAEEVGNSWGGQQLVAGPFLGVPLRRTVRISDKAVGQQIEWLTFLPKSLDVQGSIEPEIRRRGIFETAVYRADLKLKGSFELPDIGSVASLENAEILWQDAILSFSVSDLRGLRSRLELDWNGRRLELAPLAAGSASHLGLPTLGAKVPADPATGEYHFNLVLAVNGSSRLTFLPLGRDTTTSLLSSWDTPSFTGAFLPDQRTIDKTGFRANWSIPFFARSFPQAFGSNYAADGLYAAAYGVELKLPVDTYQKTDRSLKYGGLFVLLTFLTFLLFELFEGRRLHVIQYLLVGFAMSMFYLLLLSLGEHLAFRLAYLVAAAAVTLLISGYARAILGSRRGSAWLFGVLVVLYAFLCILLESEDYALLVGSLALFGVLSLVMYLTRHVDWSGSRPAAPAEPEPERLDPRTVLGPLP
jgi:inner membrane protein